LVKKSSWSAAGTAVAGGPEPARWSPPETGESVPPLPGPTLAAFTGVRFQKKEPSELQH
jgi:hypothetical protein